MEGGEKTIWVESLSQESGEFQKRRAPGVETKEEKAEGNSEPLRIVGDEGKKGCRRGERRN